MKQQSEMLMLHFPQFDWGKKKKEKVHFRKKEKMWQGGGGVEWCTAEMSAQCKGLRAGRTSAVCQRPGHVCTLPRQAGFFLSEEGHV